MPARYPVFVKRDLDGFFGLFVDNLVQLLLIVQLCGKLGIGGGSSLMLSYILPGAAISILIGNVYYAIQAHFVARAGGRSDVTALPFGINTPSLLIYIYFVMARLRTDQERGDRLAGGHGGLPGERTDRVLRSVRGGADPPPHAAGRPALDAGGHRHRLHCDEVHARNLQRPLVGMLPLAIILITYFSRVGFPLGLPAASSPLSAARSALVAAPRAAGVAGRTGDGAAPSAPPGPSAGCIIRTSPVCRCGTFLKRSPTTRTSGLGFVSVIIPMGLFNVLGSLQNIESAEAAGDRFPTAASLR